MSLGKFNKTPRGSVKVGGKVMATFPVLEDPPKDTYVDTEVLYADVHKAKLKAFHPTEESVEIEFLGEKLIPPTMWVPISDVTFPYGGTPINPHLRCPKCAIAWTETMLFRFAVWDCKSCGAKKEDYAT